MTNTFLHNNEDYESLITFKEGKIIDSNGVVLAEEFSERRWFNDVLTNYLIISQITSGIFLFSRMETTTRVGKDDWEHYSEKLCVISKVASKIILEKYDYLSYSFSKTSVYAESFLNDMNKVIFLESVRPILGNITLLDNIKKKSVSFDSIREKDIHDCFLNIDEYYRVIQEGVEKVFIELIKFHIVQEIVYKLNRDNKRFTDEPSSSILTFSTQLNSPRLSKISNSLYNLHESGVKILILTTGVYYRFVIRPQKVFGFTPVDYLVSKESMNHKIQMIIDSKYKQYFELMTVLDLPLKPLKDDILNIKLTLE